VDKGQVLVLKRGESPGIKGGGRRKNKKRKRKRGQRRTGEGMSTNGRVSRLEE